MNRDVNFLAKAEVGRTERETIWSSAAVRTSGVCDAWWLSVSGTRAVHALCGAFPFTGHYLVHRWLHILLLMKSLLQSVRNPPNNFRRTGDVRDCLFPSWNWINETRSPDEVAAWLFSDIVPVINKIGVLLRYPGLLMQTAYKSM